MTQWVRCLWCKGEAQSLDPQPRQVDVAACLASSTSWVAELWVQVRDAASVRKMEREWKQHGHTLMLAHTHAITHTQTSFYLQTMKININMYHFNMQSMIYFTSFFCINLWKSALTLYSVSEFGLTIFRVIKSCMRQGLLPTCSHIRRHRTGVWLCGDAARTTLCSSQLSLSKSTAPGHARNKEKVRFAQQRQLPNQPVSLSPRLLPLSPSNTNIWQQGPLSPSQFSATTVYSKHFLGRF